jgi:hypothetical protein
MESFADIWPTIFQSAFTATAVVILLAWSSFWKILALYRTASRKQKAWFVVLFFVNTAGILEIIYLAIYRTKPKRA